MTAVIADSDLGFDIPSDWTLLADCQYVDPEIFFVEQGGDVKPAKRICRGCPVRIWCLEYALGNQEWHGIWAGLSEKELRIAQLDYPGRPIEEILAAADARYFAKRDAATAKRDRRYAAERAKRAANSAQLAA